MEQETLNRMYEACMKMDLSQFPNIIAKTVDHDEKRFITQIYNFFLQRNQREYIANEKF